MRRLICWRRTQRDTDGNVDSNQFKIGQSTSHENPWYWSEQIASRVGIWCQIFNIFHEHYL